MRILIFTSQGHPQANFVLKKFLERNSQQVVAIFESTRLLPKRSNLQALYRYITVSGMQYVLHQAVLRLKYRFLTQMHTLLQVRDAISEYYSYQRVVPEIPVINVWDAHDPKVIGIIKSYKPDVFVSIFYNQIFTTDVLQIPRLGTVNLHPAYLPKYRGVSPTFWALANEETSTGVTLHTIDDEAIDAGRIVSQRKIKIVPDDSETSLYRRCATAGVALLLEMMDNLRRKKDFFQSLPKMKGKAGSYYSLPKKEAVEKFLKLGRKF